MVEVKRGVFGLGVFLVACMANSVMAGGSVDIGLNNSAAMIDFDATKVGSPLHLSAGALYDVDEGIGISAGLHAFDQRHQGGPIFFGLGTRMYGYFSDRNDGGALALGGFVRYSPEVLQGFGLYSHFYYAPRVTSFANTENLWDAQLRAEYTLIPSAKVFVGYRTLNIGLREKKQLNSKKNFNLANAFLLGVRLNF